MAGAEAWRAHLQPHRTVHVALPLSARALGQVDEKGERVIVPGTYDVAVGGAQPDGWQGGLTGSFTVSGPARTLPR